MSITSKRRKNSFYDTLISLKSNFLSAYLTFFFLMTSLNAVFNQHPRRLGALHLFLKYFPLFQGFCGIFLFFSYYKL